MSILLKVLLALQVICALVMIILILMQQGKGATAGATFGSGASGSLFGASGSATFLSRTTAVLASIFFVTTLVLAYYGNAGGATGSSVLSHLPAAGQTTQQPATTAPATPSAEAGTTPAESSKKSAPEADTSSAVDQIPTATAPITPDATPTPTTPVNEANKQPKQ